MVKTYENFLRKSLDLIKPKNMNAEKFARFLVDFINSVIEKDSVIYSWGNINDNLETHKVGARELEEYVISINEYDKDRATIEFCELDDYGNRKLKEIIKEIKSIQEFIRITMTPIFNEDFIQNLSNPNIIRIKYMIKLKDIEKIKDNINKVDYEVFLSTKIYNL